MAIREVRPHTPRAPLRLRTSLDFEELHARYFADVASYIARRIGDRDLAEELAQETFLRAYRARDRFDPERPFWPWLQQIAQNLVRNALRDEGRRRAPLRSLGEALMQPDGDRLADPEAAYEIRERGAVMRSALGDLSPRSRRVLLQRCDDASYEQIAETEGLSNDAVKSLLQRTRKNLRVALSRWEGDLALVFWPLRRLTARLRRAGGSISMLTQGMSADSFAPLVASGVAIIVLSGAMVLGTGVRPQRANSETRRPSAASVTTGLLGGRHGPSSARSVIRADGKVVRSPDAPVSASAGVEKERGSRRVRLRQDDSANGGGKTVVWVQVPCDPSPQMCATVDAAVTITR